MAQKKSIQRQIMEAGVAEMFESYGFSKVSVALYKKEEDFGIWYTSLVPGSSRYNGKDCFEDVTGFYIKGMDEIADIHDNITDVPPSYLRSYPMRKSRVRVHYATNVRRELADQSPGNQYYPKHRQWIDHIRNHYTPYRTLVRPFFKHHPDILENARPVVWKIREDRTVDDFARDFCEYWPRVFASRTEAGWFTKNEIQWQGLWSLSGIDHNQIACYWLAGERDRIEAELQDFQDYIGRPAYDLACDYADYLLGIRKGKGRTRDEVVEDQMHVAGIFEYRLAKARQFVEALERLGTPS